MKKILALFLVTMMITMMGVSASATGLELLDTSKLNMEYYEQFKGQDISINVYNWGEYISNGEDETLDINKAFEELTGITVYYTNFATNEELYAKLKGGGVSYDVIIPSDYMIGKMINEDMLEELNKDNIPNLANLDPNFMGAYYDPANAFSVPYTWGSVVLIYNTTMVDEADAQSWSALWNEKYADNILMFNNPRDAMGLALLKEGKGLNPESQADVDLALESLKAQKPVVQAYVMDEIFDKMAAGEAAIAPYYAGDALTMMDDNPDLNAVHPVEGTNIFVDAMCIPKGAEQKAAAEMYINFMLEGEVGAANIEYIGYSTPNTSALAYLDEEITSNPISYPSAEVVADMDYFSLLSDDLNLALDTAWTDLHTSDESFSFWIAPVLIVIALVVSIILIIRSKKRKQDY